MARRPHDPPTAPDPAVRTGSHDAGPRTGAGGDGAGGGDEHLKLQAPANRA
ncbi:MAG TPA: hypothetical protein VK601_00110 [Kofleriaceae bacterium]|nr:hypothetical protein [Kofleriaceae bacterium]